MSLGLAASPALPPASDPGAGGPRGRWAFWRSPQGQPGWARPVLLGIAAAAAVLFAWNITSAGLAPFYSVAVKSMSVSWKAFFYGALDPKATITIDKLAGSFLPQALSARLFGYHPWSLALPQVIEGVIAVLVMYRVVRRWAGVVPGLLAAALLAFTPIAASMFGHSMEDGALTMCLVLAADSWQRAVTTARLRSLIWSGVWVGLGFQAKMLQAWMILPALAVGYLLAAPGGLGRRLGQLAVAGSAMLAVSLSWIALYTVTPAGSRPYVDGSTSNSAFAMVFGYNGLERFGITVPGAVTSGPGVSTGGRSGAPGGFGQGSGRSGFGPGGAFGGAGVAGGSGAASGSAGGGSPVSRGRAGLGGSGTPGGSAVPGGAVQGGQGTGGQASGGGLAGGSGFPGGASGRFAGPAGVAAGRGGPGGAGGWAKLIGSRFGPQIAWLFPLALATLAVGLAWRRRAPRTDAVRAGLVMWGGWLLTYGLVYSEMGSIPHTAYMASLAPPVAALSGAGIVLCWRWYRPGHRRGWLAPAVVAAELAWAWFLWSPYPGFLPWARWAALVIGGAAAVVLAAGLLARRLSARLAAAGLAAGVAAMVAAPATWAGSVLDVAYAGTSFDASAGPSGGFGPGGAGTAPAAAGAFAGRFRELPGGAGFGGAGLDGPGSGGFGGPGSGGSGSGGSGFGSPGSGGTGGVGGLRSGSLAAGPGGGRGGGLIATASTVLTSQQRRIYDYVSAHRDGAGYLMAVQSWSQASPYILATGQEVMPMGGFSGGVPEPTLAQARRLVRSGQLRFFLLGGGGQRGGSGSTTAQVARWVQSTCRVVPAKDYGGSSAAAGTGGSGSGGPGFGGFGDPDGGGGTLYLCGKAG